jgi:DNA-binding NarL/FixJ family response regulator
MTGEKHRAKTGEGKSKVLIVDDHPIVRQGLSELINHEKDLTVCGQAEDAQQAMAAIRSVKPDVVVVDISLKEKNGIELMKDIKAQYPNMPVLVLSMHDESLYAERALRAGARGYIMKQEATEKVVTGIRTVLSGQVYVSDKMAAKMVYKLVGGGATAGASPVESLSDRELEVFNLIGHGLGTRQIAEKLYLSIKTIETYRAHIKEKLNLVSAGELLQYAIQWVNTQDKTSINSPAKRRK